jgi:hypothetical protein
MGGGVKGRDAEAIHRGRIDAVIEEPRPTEPLEE